MIGGLLSRLRSLLGETSEEPAEPDREPVTSLPEGYEEATIGIEEAGSPAMFDAPVPDIHCDLCGEPFSSYWVWFNHLEPEHGFESIEEASDWATVIAPTDHEEAVES
jgi:hypothetical protein